MNHCLNKLQLRSNDNLLASAEKYQPRDTKEINLVCQVVVSILYPDEDAVANFRQRVE